MILLMTQKEIKEALAKAKDPEWFKEVSIELNLPHIGVNVKKKGFASIYTYIKRQVKAWDKFKKIPSVLHFSAKQFIDAEKSIDELLNDATELDKYGLNNKWSSVAKALNNLEKGKHFTADSPFTVFLVDTHLKGDVFSAGALDYLRNDINIGSSSYRNDNPRSNQYFTGVMMAYEFSHKDSEITQRRNREKHSYTQLHNEFEALLAQDQEAVQHQLDEIAKSRTDMIEAYQQEKSELRQQYTEDLGQVVQQITDKAKQVENDKSSWLTTNKDTVAEQLKTWTQQIATLETTYNEKLKLEAPARYWNQRAQTLTKEGKRWLWWFIGCCLTGVFSLGVVLYFISNGTLAELFTKTGSAIRWSLVFITFISFLAYGIRLFSRLTFSTFHLARDAEEREQLVYVYLSLKKDKDVSEAERNLVMQSIFSRSDSGLLKDADTPTMPGTGGIIEKIIK